MYPASFDYHRPQSLAEALDLIGRYGEDGKVIAGGHSIVPILKLRLAQPAHLVDVSAVPELRGICVRDGTLDVGAFSTHRQVESSTVVLQALPCLSSVAGRIADPQIRNRGTIGGSLVHADPAADYPASALALDAQLVCVSSVGERVVPAADWFTGLMSTALQENELLVRVRFPLLAADARAVYLKLVHPASRFAVVGVAANARLARNGEARDLRIAITGVGEVPRRATGTEALLRNARLDEATIAGAAAQAAAEIEPAPDLFFSADDKRDLCRAHVRRALLQLRDMPELSGPGPA